MMFECVMDFVERQVATPTAECQGVYEYMQNYSAYTCVDQEVVSESSGSDMLMHGYTGLDAKPQHNDGMAELLPHASSMGSVCKCRTQVRPHLLGQTSYATLVDCGINLVLCSVRRRSCKYILKQLGKISIILPPQPPTITR